MRKQTCKFVPASTAFEGMDWAWNELNEQDLPFSFGDNNRTLVTASRIAAELQKLEGSYSSVEDDKRLDAAIQRLRELGGTYIDLEN